MPAKNRSRLFVVFSVLLVMLIATAVQSVDPKPDTGTTVVAEGTGKDEKEAKKAAFRDAVSKVVGTLIDSETLIKNDEIISERILEYSGGFIKSYEVLKTETTDGGLVRIRIRATVERLQIATKLRDAKVTTKEVKGADLLAERMTKEEARKNATQLVAKLFEDLPKIMLAEVVGKPRLNDLGDAVLIDVEVSVDQKKYGEFVKKAVGLFDKLAIQKDSVLLNASAIASERGVMVYNREATAVFNKPDLGEQTPKGWAVWMLTSVDGRYLKARWNYYWIDSDIAESLATLRGEKRLTMTLDDEKNERISEYELRLTSTDLSSKKDVKPILGGSSLSDFLLFNQYYRNYTVWNENRQSVTLVVAPFAMRLVEPQGGIWTGSGSKYKMIVTISNKIRLTDKELERVKSIKATVSLHTPTIAK